MEGAITVLKEQGMLRQMGECTFKAVESWEEKQQLLQERHEEAKLGEQLKE